MLSREYMQQKLMTWNPQWNRQTIESWSLAQLKQVYKKEAAKTVSFLYTQLGVVK